MPGMTTMPIFQSAPPANGSAKALGGTVAAENIPDPRDLSPAASNPGAANAAKTSSSNAAPSAEDGSTSESFATALQRQLAQSSSHDTPAPDSPSLPSLVLPIQPVSGGVNGISSPPVSVETLLSDLSDVSGFADRQSPSSNTAPLSPGLVAVEGNQYLPVVANIPIADLKNLPDTSKVAPEGFKSLPAPAKTSDISVQASDTPSPKLSLDDFKNLPAAAGISDAPPQPASPVEILLNATTPQQASQAKDDNAPQEMSRDGLAALASLMLSIRPSEVIKPESEVVLGDKRRASTSISGLLPTPTLPVPVMAQSNMDMDTAPATISESLSGTPGKSAEFAATQTTLTEVLPANAGHSESIEPEKSFEALLAAAQALSQHRTNGVHAATSSSAPLPVHTPVGTRGWDGEIGDKLVWMVGRQEQRAELVLNPPQMGRIEVSLSVNDGQTSALFVSANPAVRDALEAALPRLREILADAGISLGQTQVGADTGNNAGNSSTNNAENRDNSGRGSSKDQLAPGNEILRQLDAPQWLKRGNGLVDIFA